MINKVNSSKKENTNNEYLVGGYLHIFEKCEYDPKDEFMLYINSEYAGTHKGFTLNDINKSINIIRCLKNENINKVVYRLASQQAIDDGLLTKKDIDNFENQACTFEPKVKDLKLQPSDNSKDFEFTNKISDADFNDLLEKHKNIFYPIEIHAYQTSDKEVFTEKEKSIEHQKRIELDQKIKDDLKEVELNFRLSDTNTLSLYISDFIFSNLEFIKKL